MNKPELAAGLVVLAFGVSLLTGALAFPVLVNGVPGPAFLPIIIALGVLAAGASLVLTTLRGRGATAEPVRWAPPEGWMRVGILLAALAVSFLLLEALGFLIVSTVFMAAMIWSLGERSWRMLTIVPVLSAGALHAVFAVWLRVPLPKGILTFLD